MRPYLRAANVDWGGLKLAHVKCMNFTDHESTIYRLAKNDILLTEASGSPDEVGKSAMWAEEVPDCCFQNTLIRVRSRGVNPRYLYQLLTFEARRGAFVAGSRGVGINHLGSSRISTWPILLPPLVEQGRILQVLDTYTSMLDAASTLVKLASARVNAVQRSVVQQAYLEAIFNGRTEPVSAVAEVRGGIQKQQKRIPRANAHPFLRVANVGRGHLNLTDMHNIELFEGEGSRFVLVDGDLLVVEGNGSPTQIGRAALWRNEIPRATHQNHLIRVRPQGALSPEYLELIWNSAPIAEQLLRIASSSSGLYTLSTSKVSSIRIPVPSLSTQLRLVERVREVLRDTQRLAVTVDNAERRGGALRLSILAAANNGLLVDQDPTDEPADVLLARIRAEREAAKPKPRKPRARKATTT